MKRDLKLLFLLPYCLTFFLGLASHAQVTGEEPSTLRSEVIRYEAELNDLKDQFDAIKNGQDHQAQAELLYKIGSINVDMGDIQNLEETLDQLAEVSRSANDIRIQAKMVGLESEFFRLKGLYRHSLQSYKNFVVLQDSIATLNQIEALNELSKQNEAREKELKQEQVQKMTYGAYALGGILVVAICFLLYGMYKRRRVEGLNTHLATLLSDYVGSYSSKLTDPSFKKQVITEVHDNNEINVEGLTDDLVVKILDGLKRFEEEKKYLKQDTSITDVADYINTNKTYLSKVINVVKKKPFTNYINELRLVHAIQMLKDQEYKKYTIRAISKEAGFKSKSTFNTAFKEYTGMTPSEFIKSLN